ncbi:hypothetical protein [Paludisphaera rhizosphaerae]|nr:hypothetical protein [Paludisphaera rhizosphaerae]
MIHRSTTIAVALFAAFGSSRAESPAASTNSTVGMPARIDQLVIPGTELEVKPIEDRREPLILRIVDAFPHGSAFRYNLVYYALEPGEYDLRKYLRRKDGSELGEVPAIAVRVTPTLAAGQIQPHSLQLEPSPPMGGYRFLIAVGASLWLAGLTYILMRGRRTAASRRVEAARPITLGERLKPLVGAAIDGTLDDSGRAELERLLIGYWRDRLGLQGERPAVALAAMRANPEAGPLLRGLEDWLHRPDFDPKARGEELAALLRPYLNADETIPAHEGEPAQVVAGGTS